MFFVGGVRSDMVLYYERGEVSMGLLYCGANTASRQPSLVVSGGNFPNSMQHFEGLSASELCALSR